MGHERDPRSARDAAVAGGAHDELALVEQLLRRAPGVSRNKQYELFASELGKRARRRASFLRSLALELERVRGLRGVVELARGGYARGAVRVTLRAHPTVRHAYLTEPELALLERVFPLAARVLEIERAGGSGAPTGAGG